MEREIFGVDRNGNPLQPRLNTETKQENIRIIAKGIEQRFFETKVKYENLSYIKYDGQKKVKPLINKLNPNIENRFSKAIFTEEQRYDMKH